MKKYFRLNESQLNRIVSECVKNAVYEAQHWAETPQGQFQLGRLAYRKGENPASKADIRRNPGKYPVSSYMDKARTKGKTGDVPSHSGRFYQRNLQNYADQAERAGVDLSDEKTTIGDIPGDDNPNSSDNRKFANASYAQGLDNVLRNGGGIRKRIMDRGKKYMYNDDDPALLPFDDRLQDIFGPDAKTNPATADKGKRGLSEIIARNVRKVLKEEMGGYGSVQEQSRDLLERIAVFLETISQEYKTGDVNQRPAGPDTIHSVWDAASRLRSELDFFVNRGHLNTDNLGPQY